MAFQPEPIIIQSPKVIPIIEMQYDNYEPPKTYQVQQQIPATLPLYQVKQLDPLPIIAIVGIVGLLALFGFLAFMAVKR
jgi:hypothetical protein